ncbi:hypothetical protein [Gracilimonas mengyeensis]|uniref:Sigma-70 region 2 n=1 Tax=Gracilimonas mengyeensis TaxID=1302730 RepID=A0A521FDE1_9BACT|nr:hypothetical protein [Gracilimonas mengyeensis]SMO94044.1 Sigma-70 region 2 [Gracilimonas mengyeensis]
MPGNQSNSYIEQHLPPMDELLKLAAKYSRRESEAEDLVQDLLLETVQTERNISDENYMPWAHGFLRNHAAFIARSEGRRRKRERTSQNSGSEPSHERVQFPAVFIDELSASLQRTARLINCALNKKEIMYLLDITDTAFRQRLTALRKQWDLYAEKNEVGLEIRTESEADNHLDIGLLRRSLRNSFHGDPAKVIGSFDPDGNLLVFRSKSAHKTKASGNSKGEAKT